MMQILLLLTLITAVTFTLIGKLLLAKLAFMFVGLWFTMINVAIMTRKNETLPAANLFWWAVSVFMFIVLQFNLYK
jgi:hypothetical protein